MPEFAPCPNCSCRSADRVIFTWWGGFLLPPLLTHVKCQQCGVQYNGKTGNLNNTAIAISLAVSFGFGIAILLFIRTLDGMIMSEFVGPGARVEATSSFATEVEEDDDEDWQE